MHSSGIELLEDGLWIVGMVKSLKDRLGSGRGEMRNLRTSPELLDIKCPCRKLIHNLITTYATSRREPRSQPDSFLTLRRNTNRAVLALRGGVKGSLDGRSSPGYHATAAPLARTR